MCVCNPASRMCNMTKLLGGDVPTQVRYYYSPRLCCLLLFTFCLLIRTQKYLCSLSPSPLPTAAVPMGSSVHLDVSYHPRPTPPQPTRSLSIHPVPIIPI